MRAVLSLLAALLLGSGAATAQEQRSWAIVAPDTPLLPFSGQVNFDSAGQGAGAMLYPAPGLAGFIAAVVTHGILVDGIKRSQKTAMQEAADKVLEPYKPFIESLKPLEVLGSAVPRMSTAGAKRVVAKGEPVGGDWIVETFPAYTLTQDMRAVMVDNAVLVYRDGQRENPSHQSMVRVVSSPLVAGTDPNSHWTRDGGRALSEMTALLWSESLDIAIEGLGKTREGPEKTLRFMEGGSERIERAQLLRESCDRALLRTLRGELMSVPRKSC